MCIVEDRIRVKGGAGPMRQVVRLHHLIALDQAINVAAYSKRRDSIHDVIKPKLENGEGADGALQVDELQRHCWVLRG